MQTINFTAILLLTTFSIFSCSQPNENNNKHPVKRTKPANKGYHFEKTKEWLKNKNTEQQQTIILAVNRTDSSHLAKMDTIIVPNDAGGKLEYYLPFPLSVPFLKDMRKIIFFSYPSQTFAAYGNGELIYTGPTNMGRKADPTPTGLYFTNWKAEQTTSTFNDEWDLKWNFNIENKLGIGFHQYELPGYPASHSCLRLQEKDARHLYDWADQWILSNADSIRTKGTPVIVFGVYPFGLPKPWMQLVSNPAILEITEAMIEKEVSIHLKEILAEQQKRAAIEEVKK